LHGDTNAEDKATGDNTHSSTEKVCHRGSEESTNEGTSREDGDDQRLGGSRYDIFWLGGIVVPERLEPELDSSHSENAIIIIKTKNRTHGHFLDTRDGTSIIAEEDSIKGNRIGNGSGTANYQGNSPACSIKMSKEYLKTKKEHKSDWPKAANEAMRMPTIGDFLPLAIPVAITAPPPPGIFDQTTGEPAEGKRLVEPDVGRVRVLP
jgi:hypothetical protein